MKQFNIISLIKSATGGLIFIVFLFSSCKKQDDFLNAKRNLSDVTPKTLQDFQAILDNNQVMNGQSSITGLLGTDNIYVPDANLDGTDQPSRNAYLWAKDIYQGGTADDWLFCYQVVEYANIVLDGLKNISSKTETSSYNNVDGSALFFRAYAFYQLSQLYCKPYINVSASTDLGIPLRLSSDVNIKDTRATVQQTYDQIINDLKQAALLLPKVPLYKTRPSSVAANALLAKVYLATSDYKNALSFSNASLADYSTILDYNTLTLGTRNPFPTFAKGHPEVIFHAWSIGLSIAWPNGDGRIAPSLFQSYDANDLRKSAFFSPDGNTGLNIFIGSYSANPYNFCGIATDEIYLIRAEANVRLGNVPDALKDLNALLVKRYVTGTFNSITTSDPTTLLKRIILERQKEMPFTANIRWEDLRRLNQESALQTQLTRTYHNVLYQLAPNDPRYVLPLPDDEIQLNNVPQNIR